MKKSIKTKAKEFGRSHARQEKVHRAGNKKKADKKQGAWYKRPSCAPMPQVYVGKDGRVGLLYWMEKYK